MRLSLDAIDRNAFPLPNLSHVILRWREQIVLGCGMVVARGLPVRSWGIDASTLAYLGIASYLGRVGEQTPKGELIGHVTDVRGDTEDPLRGYQTSRGISFHCDAADIVGLLCLNPAREGGESLVASSATIFNAIFRSSPRLANRLFQPVKVHLRGWDRHCATDAPVMAMSQA